MNDNKTMEKKLTKEEALNLTDQLIQKEMVRVGQDIQGGKPGVQAQASGENGTKKRTAK